MTEVWLVCGGRGYEDRDAVYAALCTIAVERGTPRRVVQGGARGADALAKEWALLFGVPFATVHAEWDKFGKAAGSLRNAKMLAEHKPTLVIAFPGGAGTADMVRRAIGAGVEVVQPAGI